MEEVVGRTVLSGALQRLLVDPRNVVGIVAVDGGLLAAERVLFRPLQEARVLDAVLGQARRVRDGAQRERHLRRRQNIIRSIHQSIHRSIHQVPRLRFGRFLAFPCLVFIRRSTSILNANPIP